MRRTKTELPVGNVAATAQSPTGTAPCERAQRGNSASVLLRRAQAINLGARSRQLATQCCLLSGQVHCRFLPTTRAPARRSVLRGLARGFHCRWHERQRAGARVRLRTFRPAPRIQSSCWCATLIACPHIRMTYGLLLISETQGERGLDQLEQAGLVFRRGEPPEAVYSFNRYISAA